MTTPESPRDAVIAALDAYVAEATSAIGPLQAQVDDLTAKLATDDASITDLNGKLSAANATVADLTTRLGDAQVTLTANTKTISGLQASLASANSTIAADATLIGQLQTQLTTANATIEQLKAELAALQPPPPPVVKPKLLLGFWDESSASMKGTGTAAVALSNLAANAGVNALMQQALGQSTHVSQIMHGYNSDNVWYSTVAGSPVAQMADFGNVALLNLGCGKDYAGVVAGKFDAQMKALVTSAPAGSTLYICPDHEPDNSSKGTDATAWAKAIGHAANVCGPVFKARGIKGGIVSCLMWYTYGATSNKQAVFDKWNWIQYVDQGNREYCVYGLDNYSKFLTPTTFEDVAGMSDSVFAMARKAGFSRFGLLETGCSLEKRNAGGQIIGTPALQAAWVADQVPKWRKIDGLEFACYFHKPTGPESKNDRLSGDALKAWAKESVA